MEGNISLAALRISENLSPSPITSSRLSASTQSVSVSNSILSRFASSFVSSVSPLNVFSRRSSFGFFLDACAVISSVSNGNFSSYQSFTSNTTVVFTNCLFHDISSSSPSTALYVLYSSCNVTVTSCSFQRLVCTYTSGYSSGAITVLSSNWVVLSSNYFTLCSASDPTIYQIAPHYSSSVYNCVINRTTEYLTGVYSGVNSVFGGMAGGIQYHCLYCNNHSSVTASTHNCGSCIDIIPRDNNFINNLLFKNCTGGSYICALYCAYSFTVGRSIFINCTASTGNFEFYYSTMSICFSQCAFVSLSAVPISCITTSGFGIVTFERCCFDTPISLTYKSVHAFISTISGQCVVYRSNSFSGAFAYGPSTSQIFPLILANLLIPSV